SPLDFQTLHDYEVFGFHLLIKRMQLYHFQILHTFYHRIGTLLFSACPIDLKQNDFLFFYSSLAAPPKSVKDNGLTGGATFNGIALVGSSFVMLVNTLSTAGRQVRPPQKPIPAL